MKTTVDELQAFAAVVDGGSITAAAEHLGQTVSGISRALGRLERKLETTLLRRTTRRLELTEEGRAFLAHARAILASIDEAEEQMAARRQKPAGRLRVNAASPFMLHAIVPLVAEFRQAFPQIELELDTDDLNIDLLERRTDIAIRIGELRDSTLHARPIATSRLRVLASPAYLAAHGRPKSVGPGPPHIARIHAAGVAQSMAAAWRARGRVAHHAGAHGVERRDAAATGSGGRRYRLPRRLYDSRRHGTRRLGAGAGA